MDGVPPTRSASGDLWKWLALTACVIAVLALIATAFLLGRASPPTTEELRESSMTDSNALVPPSTRATPTTIDPDTVALAEWSELTSGTFVDVSSTVANTLESGCSSPSVAGIAGAAQEIERQPQPPLPKLAKAWNDWKEATAKLGDEYIKTCAVIGRSTGAGDIDSASQAAAAAMIAQGDYEDAEQSLSKAFVEVTGRNPFR